MSGALALDEVVSEALAQSCGARRLRTVPEAPEVGVQQAEQVVERLFVAGMRRRGEEQHVPVGFVGEALEELVALMAVLRLARTQPCASSTMTNSGQARAKSSRRLGRLMKSSETIVNG